MDGLPEIRHPRSVLKGLARNAAAPGHVLIRLAAQRPLAREVAFHHPGPPLEVLEYLLDRGDPGLLSLLGVSCALPPQVRTRMASHPDSGVRARAIRGDASANLVESLVDDRSPEVRAEVAADRRLPLASRIKLSRDIDAGVRAAVAQFWLDPPEQVHRALLTDVNPEVRTKAVSVWHQPPPPDLLASLMADSVTRAAAVRYVSITPELIADPDERIRRAVAQHPRLDAATATVLSGDSEPSVIYALVFNPGTPEPLRNELLHRTTAQVTPGFLNSYYLKNAWKDRASTGWLWDAPLSVRLTYLDSPHFFFRRAVANTDLPPDAVARLLRDDEPGVQRNVARRNNVPPHELVRIITQFGDDPSVLPELTDLPHFPQSAYEDFATSTNPRLRALCDKAIRLPAYLVERLARDDVEAVRCAAPAHANLPLDVLTQLMTGASEQVAEAAGASPSLPKPWMHILAQHARTAFSDG